MGLIGGGRPMPAARAVSQVVFAQQYVELLNLGGAMSRTGEKIGWSAGWLGAFIWVAAQAGIFIFQGKTTEGLLGTLLVIVAVLGVLFFAPWRHPLTPYWRLMLMPYGVFLAAVVWAILSYGGMKEAGLEWWTLLWLLPMMIPLGSLSRRRWLDFDGGDIDNAD
jgi:hypothetical protein